MRKVTALILAGGEGRRMAADVPKQFLSLGGVPVISHSVKAFELSDKVSDIVIVCHQDHLSLMERVISDTHSQKTKVIVEGGETRQSSSFIGLKNCPSGTEYVLIHDSARPFLRLEMIDDLLHAVKETGAACPAEDVSDTIAEVKRGLILEVVPKREDLKKIQTPQVFSYDVIVKAHEEAVKKGITSASDDCGLVLVSGGKVAVVKGQPGNLKITSKFDLKLAEFIFSLE
jgi:2-C-methyl-D-erythritol 4-phosphate cytidylyltransferase